MKRTNLNFSAISERLLQKAAASIVVAAMLLLSGCVVHNAAISSSSAPFYLAYDLEEVIRDPSQVATITSTCGLEIDGVVVNSKNMRSANAGSFLKKQIVVADILPGEHKVKITNASDGSTVQMSDAIIYGFQAGQVYDMVVGLSRVSVKENTSEKVAQKIAENRKNNVFDKKK
jgi:hypothetical protein